MSSLSGPVSSTVLAFLGSAFQDLSGARAPASLLSIGFAIALVIWLVLAEETELRRDRAALD